ncbi:ABC transporter permease [Streptomyces sp. BK239]|uniref:ABC transporter permease n=1 Tax=Streptomyces sp. BK239 TaxID=2512155 RepID=UPI0010D650B1|nr:ABC transporter permease [Streptomyces sp. BK239]RZU17052.1 FtsX-like permease family protein [Streptomyces sp. BK239]
MFSLVANSFSARIGQYLGSLLVVVMTSALITALATILDRVRLSGLGHGAVRSAESLMGLVGSTSGLAALLLVANTFSLVVDQRLREFGVLRAIGATPAQVRLQLVGEALLVSLAGGLAGSILGTAGTGPALDWLVRNEVLPARPEAHFSVTGALTGPLCTAVIAVFAALTAVHRPVRMGALTSLREAEVPRRAMPTGRVISVLLMLALALAVHRRYEHRVGADDAVDGAMALGLMLLLTAWLLMPVLVRPLTVVGAGPGRMLSRYTGCLATVNAGSATRRTAAMTGPVLIAVGLSALLLCSAAAAGEVEGAQARRTASTRTAEPPGAAVRAGGVPVGIEADRQRRRNAVAVKTLMAPLIAFSGVGILNTLLLATRQRRREFAVLRLTGGTTGQLLRMLLWEALAVVITGVATAGAVVGVFLAVLSRRLTPFGVETAAALPWGQLTWVVAGCTVLGLLGVLVPARSALRTKAVRATRTAD